MEEYQYTIGSTVTCTDGACGELEKVVLDPETREITELVVSYGLIRRNRRVVPVSRVAGADEKTLQLDLEKGDLDDFPSYAEENYVTEEVSDFPGVPYEKDEVVWRAGADFLSFSGGTPDEKPGQMRTNSDSDTVVLEEGMEVQHGGKRVGHVSHLVLDPSDKRVLRVAVRKPRRGDIVMIPIEWIAEIGPKRIIISSEAEDWESLPVRRERSADSVIAELQGKLEAIGCGGGMIEAIYDQDSRTVELHGCVPDIATRRRVESIAEAVPGVETVRNEITTHAELEAEVTGALAEDPRTEGANIRVTAGERTVNLTGRVADTETRQAAEEIALALPDVDRVLNQIRVENQ